MNAPLLNVENLAVEFAADDAIVRAVDGVSFSLEPGETLGVVGESGAGKSVLGLALLGLVPTPPGRVAAGSIRYAGQELVGMKPRALNRIRGDRLAMIFQDPLTALNPLMTIEEQMSEVTMFHRGLSRAMATRHAIELLERVGIRNAGQRIFDYPHQFSGGMRQRVMIAMALSCRPDVLVADEPTTALDVTVQAQILELMKQLQAEQGTAILFITHDLGVVAGLCQRVNVMYAGRFVEEASAVELRAAPASVYARVIELDSPARSSPGGTLAADRRPAARSGSLAERLPVRAALPLSTGCLFARLSAECWLARRGAI